MSNIDLYINFDGVGKILRYRDSVFYAVLNGIEQALPLDSGLRVQYSADNSSWHDSAATGDKYIRVSTDSGATWQTGLKFAGTDGTTYYPYTAYASDASGTGFSLTWSAGLKYFATVHKTTVIANPTILDFTGAQWRLFCGADGADGQAGDQGEAGTTYTPYTAYATNDAGSGFSLTWNSTLKYAATVHSATVISSPSLTDFQNLGAVWKKFIGDDGATGSTGATGDGVVTGGIQLYAASTPPTGYLECNGAAVSRSSYASLYSVIGTTYGVGDGSTTFNLPDMRGVVVRGWDNGRGLDSSRTFGSYQDDAFQGHYHTIQYGGGTGQSEPMKLTYSYATQYTGMLDVGVLAPRSDGTNGTPRTAGETRMKNVALLYIIKY